MLIELVQAERFLLFFLLLCSYIKVYILKMQTEAEPFFPK